MGSHRGICTVGLAVLGLLASGAAQTRGGAIAGTVRDLDGGVLPGVTVTAIAGDVQRKVVTNSRGHYRLDDLAAGPYRVQADLAGFRRTVVEGIVVGSGSDVQRDLVMRLGIMTRPDLLGVPPGGFPGALRAADAVVHLRVTQVVGTKLLGPSEAWLTTEHVAVALTVLKGAAANLVQGEPVRFWQAYAGEWVENGVRLVGESQPYRVGDEFVGLFSREQDATLLEFVAGRFMFRVIGGTVQWRREPVPGIQDGMSVSAFIAALRQLLATGHEI